MGRDVIVACDFAGEKEVYEFLDKFAGLKKKPFVKIGMELFYGAGPQIVKEIKSRGHKIFLDLKCHDIPNTVKKTMAVLASLDVDIINVHAAGTIPMMEAALAGLVEGHASEKTHANQVSSSSPGATAPTDNVINRPLLIAVTQLTSTDQEMMERDLWIEKPLDEVVMHYALNAKKAGLDGVVCSPLEANKVHEVCGKDFITVTPGVRFDDGDRGDQKRVMTPGAAKEAGSDYIVVGRPITQADDPVAAYQRCLLDFIE